LVGKEGKKVNEKLAQSPFDKKRKEKGQ